MTAVRRIVFVVLGIVGLGLIALAGFSAGICQIPPGDPHACDSARSTGNLIGGVGGILFLVSLVGVFFPKKKDGPQDTMARTGRFMYGILYAVLALTAFVVFILWYR